jgi:hypothetical protein
VIGAALAMKATDHGHRRVTSDVGMLLLDDAGWLRRLTRSAESIRSFLTALAHSLDPLLGPLAPAGSALADAVDAIATAAQGHISPRSSFA